MTNFFRVERMIEMNFNHVLTISGASLELFKYTASKKLFEINKRDLPDAPTQAEAQKTFLLPGYVTQDRQGIMNYRIAFNAMKEVNQQGSGEAKLNDAYTQVQENDYFVDNAHRSILVLYSPTTNTRAYFNQDGTKDDTQFEFYFSAIYPYNERTFTKMKNSRVIIYNI